MKKEERSYKIEDVAANVEIEIRRLKAQVELFWEKELRCFRMFGLADGMSILECGCGPGHLLEKLMLNFPHSNITGVEIDPLLVKTCNERLFPVGKNRIKVFEQSIMQMEFPDDSFDFAISRLVLEHLPDPLNAVSEIYRVLKPGGKCVLIDNDFDMHLKVYPDISELDELYRAYCSCRTDEGGNPRIGRELPGILQKSGFTGVDLEIVNAHSQIIGDDVFLMSEGSGIPAKLVRDRYLSRDIFDKLAVKWHDVLKQKHHIFFRQLFVAAGEKICSSNDQQIRELPSIVKNRDRGPIQEILKAASDNETTRLLTYYLRLQLAALLEVEHEALDIYQPLIALGINSLMSVELANTIITDFNIRISAVDILEAQNICLLAERLGLEIVRLKETGSFTSVSGMPDADSSGERDTMNDKSLSGYETEWEEGYI